MYEIKSLSRWQEFFSENPKLGSIPSSRSANKAARIFSDHNCKNILDLGCGSGRDSLCLAENDLDVIGLDAARAGLYLAQKRVEKQHSRLSWIESDSRKLPFPNVSLDGVYCFGLLHEFVGESANANVRATMGEIYRILKVSGIAIVATVAGDPEKGLPHVQNFSEEMFDATIGEFRCIEKKVFDDLGCTGRSDYKVWFGYLMKN